MKLLFLHLSDLHLGKRIHEAPLIEDQTYILNEILKIADIEKPDGVLIAGDIYDKAVPSAEAVSLFDDFLVNLKKRGFQVFVISGNHDSPDRLAFGSRIMDEEGIHLSPVYNGDVKPITLSDEHGKLNVYMLPFIKPMHVKRFFEDEQIVSYTDAVRVAISAMRVNTLERNILLTHQFVTGATVSGSEDELSVGGADNVDASIFDCFDYVALGHIHGAQKCGRETVRYSGTPLKYSFAEINHKKSVTVVEFGDKNTQVQIRTVALTALRDMQEIKGTFSELTCPTFYEGKSFTDNYLRIVLTDEMDVPDAYASLRLIYKNMLTLSYDNSRTRSNSAVGDAKGIEEKSAFELFADLFIEQNNQPMSIEQSEYLKSVIESVEEGEL
jgi:exonuclease SbcD